MHGETPIQVRNRLDCSLAIPTLLLKHGQASNDEKQHLEISLKRNGVKAFFS